MPGNWIQRVVGTTVVEGLGYNKNRTWIIIYNNAANPVEWEHSPFKYGAGGIIPPQSGVSLAECENDDTHTPIFLIANQAGNDVRIYESTGTVNSFTALLRELR